MRKECEMHIVLVHPFWGSNPVTPAKEGIFYGWVLRVVSAEFETLVWVFRNEKLKNYFIEFLAEVYVTHKLIWSLFEALPDSNILAILLQWKFGTCWGYVFIWKDESGPNKTTRKSWFQEIKLHRKEQTRTKNQRNQKRIWRLVGSSNH